MGIESTINKPVRVFKSRTLDQPRKREKGEVNVAWITILAEYADYKQELESEESGGAKLSFPWETFLLQRDDDGSCAFARTVFYMAIDTLYPKRRTVLYGPADKQDELFDLCKKLERRYQGFDETRKEICFDFAKGQMEKPKFLASYEQAAQLMQWKRINY